MFVQEETLPKEFLSNDNVLKHFVGKILYYDDFWGKN